MGCGTLVIERTRCSRRQRRVMAQRFEGVSRKCWGDHMPHSGDETDVMAETPEECPQCLKPKPLCICDSVTVIENRIPLLILQHPQEQDRALGTARLAVAHLSNATLRVGLSWPSLAKAYGETVSDPARWAVLYLGSARAAQREGEGRGKGNGEGAGEGQGEGADDIIPLTAKGVAADNPRAILRAIRGVVLLDGTWSQAKALWWRNPWMLKCQRIILNPASRSRYGRLRREPRREGLSTIEAAGMVLASLESRPEIAQTLNASFERMLARFREVQNSMPELAPRPAPKNHYRRSRRSRRTPQKP